MNEVNETGRPKKKTRLFITLVANFEVANGKKTVGKRGCIFHILFTKPCVFLINL